MQRRKFNNTTGMAGGMLAVTPLMANGNLSEQPGFPLTDLHVHTTQNFTVDSIMDIAVGTGVQFGIVENPGSNVRDDATLQFYVDRLRQYPVYIGLQPMAPGWTRNFSADAISLLDYVIMDPQTVPMGNGYGETLRIWNFDTYVDDTEKFMEAYVAHSLEVLNNDEPIHIFGWPLFLPVCIARDYYTLWTQERMQQIIAAARKRNIAIEINDMAHTPHEEFILMAKEAGLKFTFGSDTRDLKAGRLDYCKYIAAKCNLTRDDFFVPTRNLTNA
jgi:hypothetical protein